MDRKDKDYLEARRYFARHICSLHFMATLDSAHRLCVGEYKGVRNLCAGCSYGKTQVGIFCSHPLHPDHVNGMEDYVLEDL
jgi:hypothetical protein